MLKALRLVVLVGIRALDPPSNHSGLEGGVYDEDSNSGFSFGGDEPQQNCDFQYFPGTNNPNLGLKAGALCVAAVSRDDQQELTCWLVLVAQMFAIR